MTAAHSYPRMAARLLLHIASLFLIGKNAFSGIVNSKLHCWALFYESIVAIASKRSRILRIVRADCLAATLKIALVSICGSCIVREPKVHLTYSRSQRFSSASTTTIYRSPTQNNIGTEKGPPRKFGPKRGNKGDGSRLFHSSSELVGLGCFTWSAARRTVCCKPSCEVTFALHVSPP